MRWVLFILKDISAIILTVFNN